MIENQSSSSSSSPRVITTALTSLLQVKHPIISAPMCGMGMGKLAGSVASAGGVGLIGVGAAKIFGPERVKQEFSIAQEEMRKQRKGCTTGVLGFGFLESFMDDMDESFEACLSMNPEVIFLSGFTLSRTDSPEKWIRRIRGRSSGTKIIVQSFTVSEAVSAASLGADAIVIQGCDAGGHGRQQIGVSIVSLIPQTRLALSEQGFSDCVVVAAGGIVNGTQIAAALTLGADGVLMGSVFVVTEESLAKDSFKGRILETKDGTSGTAVSAVWDHLSSMGGPFLSGGYVGRALVDSETFTRFEGKDPKTEISEEDKAWYANADYKARAVWCSSSIGLIRSRTKASHVLEKAMADAIVALRSPKHFSFV